LRTNKSPVLLLSCLLLSGLSVVASEKQAVKTTKNAHTAVFYGPNPPSDVLSQFNRLIVEADNIKPAELKQLLSNNASIFAYLSVGEVAPSRRWFNRLEPSWMLGENKVWDSKIMDLASPGWQDFVIETLVSPLWQKGYRGIFLDTMDSFKLLTASPGAEKKQIRGLTDLLNRINKRYPDMRLIANRGFEVLPSIGHMLEAVAAESLFASWDNSRKVYTETKESDQQWLITELEKVRREFDVDIIIIDYMAPDERQKANALARRIDALGYIPWISVPALDMVGVSHFKPRLKTYLLLTDSKKETHYPLETSKYRRLVKNLNAKGFHIQAHDIQTGMPRGHMIGRYKAILTAQPYQEQFAIYKNWIKRQKLVGALIKPLLPKAAITGE